MGLSAVRELTASRIRILVREPEVIFWVFLFPVLMALGLGVAFSDPAPDIFEVAVESGTPAVAHVSRLEAQEGLSVRVVAPAEGAAGLARGELALVVGGPDGATLRFDPTRPEGRQARILVELALLRGAAGTGTEETEPDPGFEYGATGSPAAPELQVEPVEQRGWRYIDWLIPGLIGFNLMSTGLWAMGFYITQMRQSRQLKRLSATPMRRTDFLAAQILARFSFLALEVPVLVLFAWWVFGVEVQGNLVELALLVLLGAACFSALGLLAAARARTVEAASGIINVLLLPMTVLSGVFFSASRFPDAAQPLIQLLPLTALNDALRGVYNDGLSLLSLGPELVVLAAWTVGAFLAALRLFRWQ